MASQSGVGFNIHWEMIPFISSASVYANAYNFPGGAFDNKSYFSKNIKAPKSISEEELMLLFDPQTSGGLLISLNYENLDDFRKRAEEADQPIWIIGDVVEGKKITIK
jgi:selenide,water dikinase